MSKLMDKLMKSTKIKDASVLSGSTLFVGKGIIQTAIPIINIALSGDLDGGLRSGLTSIAGPSRHFKTNYALLMAAAYQKKYEDAIILFYDSEFGTGTKAFASFGIDSDRVMHIPITNIEELTFDIMKKLDNANDDGLKRGDHVFILIDSVGNLASIKEVDDAIEGSSAADMSRARKLKSMYRMITPHLTLKDIPMVAINHVYTEMKMFGKDIMSGGQGGMLSSDNVWFIGRAQDKDGTELLGYKFTINIEKSRYVKEKSKFPVMVKFDGGISKYTGILELAVDAGEVIKPKNGRYQLVDKSTGEILGDSVKEAGTECEEFLGVVLKRDSFKSWVRETYQIAHAQMIVDEQDD
jgi:RecA/RadA recombinase